MFTDLLRNVNAFATLCPVQKEDTMAESKKQTLARVLKDIETQPTCLLWPHAALALGISRSLAYEAAKTGEIETIRIGHRVVALTAPLRQKLKIDAA
jgi:hypothetical protein